MAPVRWIAVAWVVGAGVAMSPAGGSPAGAFGSRVSATPEEPTVAARCSTAGVAGPEYYRFPLVSTRRVPGTGRAAGTGEVTFSPSPYGIALGEDGSYAYDFTIRFERLKLPKQGSFVVWTATPALDQVALAGEMADPTAFSGKVAWNKFLVVVTLEPEFDPAAELWSGPVVIRGMSRSGMMHTMAGHGAFQQENCAAYGYE